MTNTDPLNEPFHHSELLGWCNWSPAFIKALADYSTTAYRCCHLAAVKRYIYNGQVDPHNYFYAIARGRRIKKRCSYFRLEPLHEATAGSYFGSYVLGVPLTELVDRRFYVFSRVLPAYSRVSFVQRETTTPMFSERAKHFDPRGMFDGPLSRSDRRRIEVLPINPVSLYSAQGRFCRHARYCRSGEPCVGPTDRKGAANALGQHLGIKLDHQEPFSLAEVVGGRLSNS